MTCDVLIGGGGPAGLACAWRLRQVGLDVMVVDLATFPRDKRGAGWITPQVVTELCLDTQAYARRRTFQPIIGLRVGLIGRHRETAVTYDGPVSFGIRRCEFDHYLLQRADARLALGAPISTIRKDRGQWIVNDGIRAPMLIGAGGSGCPVARMLNGVRHARPLVVAREAESRIYAADRESLAIEPDVPELFFCRDLQGYGWCVRKGKYLNVGIGRRERAAFRNHLRDFVSFLAASGRVPEPTRLAWHGHAYHAMGAGVRPLAGAGVLLAGAG